VESLVSSTLLLADVSRPEKKPPPPRRPLAPSPKPGSVPRGSGRKPRR
jgi:hypothetical protein